MHPGFGIAPPFSFGEPPPLLSLHPCSCVGHLGVGRGPRLGEQGSSPGHGELGWPFWQGWLRGDVSPELSVWPHGVNVPKDKVNQGTAELGQRRRDS